MASSTIKTTELILMGKTGNGKSETGNTILGGKVFNSSSSLTSTTKIMGEGVTTFEGRAIRVIDTPGFEDTECNEEEGLQLVIKQIQTSLISCQMGFHACLFVLRFGNRLTREEKQSFINVKKIFGENFMKKYCIIIMTYGDNFHAAHEDDQLTFQEWVSQQEGDFKEIVNECNGKIILFNNRSKDTEEKESQIRELLQLVDTLGGRRYTDKNFEKARKVREKMLLQAKLPDISDETMTEIRLIFQEINELSQTKSYRGNEKRFMRLKKKAEDLLKRNQVLDNETGVLVGLTDNIKSVITSISEQISYRKGISDQMEKQEKKEQDMETFFLQREQDKMKILQELENELEKMKGMTEKQNHSNMELQKELDEMKEQQRRKKCFLQ